MGKLTRLIGHGPTKLPTRYPPNSFLIRKPVERGVRLPKSDLPEIHHGQHIYLYHQIQTNQVVYSLSRHLHVPSPSPPLSQRQTNPPLHRTKTPSTNSPFSAKRPSPPVSAKISGPLSQWSTFPPPTPASKPIANCANSADCTRCHIRSISSPRKRGNMQALCTRPRNAGGC